MLVSPFTFHAAPHSEALPSAKVAARIVQPYEEEGAHTMNTVTVIFSGTVGFEVNHSASAQDFMVFSAAALPSLARAYHTQVHMCTAGTGARHTSTS